MSKLIFNCVSCKAVLCKIKIGLAVILHHGKEIKKRRGKRVKRISKFSTIIKRLQKLKPSQRRQAIEIAISFKIATKFIHHFAVQLKGEIKQFCMLLLK